MTACILSVTVRNRPGVLARVSDLFAHSGTNIDRMTVGEIRNPSLSRMRIEARLDEARLKNIIGCLQRMQDVLDIRTFQSRSRAFAYWSVVYGLFVTILGLNLATPLYAVYKAQWGLTPGIITLVFAAYALAVIPSIVLFGQLSDRIGYRKLLMAGAVAALSGSACMALADGLPLLLLARTLQGLSVGLFNGIAVSAMTALHRNKDRQRSAFLAAAAVTAGNALGPVMSGALAQFGPWPTQLPYLAHIALVLLGLACLLVSRSAPRKSGGPRLHWPAIPRRLLMPFLLSAVTSFIAWAVISLFMSIIPSYMGEWIGTSSLLISGVTSASVLAVSAASQLIFGRLSPEKMALAGFVLLLGGLISLVLAIHAGSGILLAASVLFTGLGHGPLYAGSLALTNNMAPEQSRGDLISSYYAVTYLGVALPVMGLGLLAQRLGLESAIGGFVLALVCVSAVGMWGWSMLNKWRKPV
ncbi:MFS transporter [Cohnella sp.]|uniref:MFS transporter n=1 Tax=Cohnella sp. TaxID=1883426 RepID=UPI0035663E7D